MKNLGCLLVCVATLATVSCKKKDNTAAGGSAATPAGSGAAPAAPAGSATGSATAATAAAPSAGKADCPAGAYVDPGGAYCVVVAEGFKDTDASGPKKEDYGTLIVFNDEDGNTFSIKVVTKENFDDFKGAMVTKPDNKNGVTILVQEKIGTDGVYERSKNGDTMYQFATVKRGEGYVACEAAYPADKPTKPEDACKTLRAM